MSFSVFVFRVKVDLGRRAISNSTMLVKIGVEVKNVTHMEIQLEIETINAVPTPRLDVGEKVFAAQLL